MRKTSLRLHEKMFHCTKIDKRFTEAVDIASKLHSLPIDVMLQFYAFYKQATQSHEFNLDLHTDQNLVNHFKFNAWMQVRELSPKKAKKEYIKLVEKHSNQKI